MPFAAGGLTDVPARVFAAMFQEKVGQNVVVENKTGGSGTIGVDLRVARRAGRLHAARQFDRRRAEPALRRRSPYHPIDDFSQVGWIVDGPPMVLVVNAGLPYKTLADMVADAKANPQKLSFGTSGPASGPAMARGAAQRAPPRPKSSACRIAAPAKRRAP